MAEANQEKAVADLKKNEHEYWSLMNDVSRNPDRLNAHWKQSQLHGSTRFLTLVGTVSYMYTAHTNMVEIATLNMV